MEAEREGIERQLGERLINLLDGFREENQDRTQQEPKNETPPAEPQLPPLPTSMEEIHDLHKVREKFCTPFNSLTGGEFQEVNLELTKRELTLYQNKMTENTGRLVNLMASEMINMHLITSKMVMLSLAERPQTEMLDGPESHQPPRQADQNDDPPRQVSVEAQKTWLNNQVTAFTRKMRLLQKTGEIGQNKLDQIHYISKEETPINRIPQINGRTNVKNSVQDSTLKLCKSFDGSGEKTADKLQDFLRSIFDVMGTASLSEHVVKSIIFRKLEGSARALMEEDIQVKGGLDNLDLKAIVLLLEKRWSTEWSAPMARRSLERMVKGNLSYQDLEAKILHTVKLAAHDLTPDDREAWQTKAAKDCFLKAVSTADVELLLTESADRKTRGLTDFNMTDMVKYLMQYNLQREQFRKTDSRQKMKSTYSGLSELEHTRMVGNPGKRDRRENDSKPKYDKGFQPNFGKPMKPNHKTKGYTNLGNHKMEERTDRKPVEQMITPQMANVAANSCIRCGSPTHHWKSEECMYKNTRLPRSPCTKCNKGAHYTKLCVNGRVQTFNRGAARHIRRGDSRAQSKARGKPRPEIGRSRSRPQHRHVRRTRSVDEHELNETTTNLWTTKYEEHTSEEDKSEIDDIYYSD